jgi:acetyltransferase-like isoleucine patch superfamily enzyme
MGVGTREALKAVARAIATVAVTPLVWSFRARSHLVGSERAIEASTQALALIPGLSGQYLRRAFLARTLAYCDKSAAIEFGTIFSDAGTRIDANVYIGPGCHIGFAHFERDVLVAPAVHVPSGRRTHGMIDPDLAMHDQPGERQQVRIGAGSWIGSGAVIMADVGCRTVIGAGAVVTKSIPDDVVAGGVPAHVLRERRQSTDRAR